MLIVTPSNNLKMIDMKKLMYVLATSILALGLMVGCSKKEDEVKYTADDVVGSYSGTLNFWYRDDDGFYDVYDDYKTSITVMKDAKGGLNISIDGKTISCSYSLDPTEAVYGGTQHTFKLSFPEQQWNGFTVSAYSEKIIYTDSECYIDAESKTIYFGLDVKKHGEKEASGRLIFWNWD